MDKIQAAIGKARAARAAATAPDPASAPPTSQFAPDPASASRSTGPEQRAEAWRPLATFAPKARQMARQRIVTFATTGQSLPGEVAFGVLRTKVLREMRANGWKRLAITSPGANCGKSTVTLNLAFSLAKQKDVHTIVAELDMRRPSLAKMLGVKGKTGFDTVIEGKADFASLAVRPRPNLAFGLNYSRAQSPAELLQSPTVGPALARIEAAYAPDLMIFDMPPMLVNDDTLAFVGQVDCVLLVAEAGTTSMREIDVCERDLAAQTNVLGVLLNKCRYMEKNDGYGGYN
ncbi:CpsD/CapB family tyrosine-protein kinase [Neptunicoccus cionae]|nr:CpsD/CapB family tyrosine-protein kinase [Amylibacter cionae]